MASLLTPPDENEDPTQATTTNISGGSSAPALTNAAGTGATPAAVPQPTSAPLTAGQANTGAIIGANQNVDFSPLTNYVAGEGTAANKAINAGNDSFNNSLGSFGAFGADQQAQLSSVLNGAAPLDTGKALLNKTVSPTAQTNSTYDPLVEKYTTDAQNLGSSTGIQSLLANLRPDLTPGDMQYDATVYGNDPNYQAAIRNIQNDASTTGNFAATTTANQGTANTSRQNDVSAFNTAAQGYVRKQNDDINQALASQETQAQKHDQDIQNELGYLQSGATPWGSAPASDFNFDPTAYQPTTLTSQYGPNVFNQTISPSSYLNYIAGQGVNANNVATPEQATQFNNAQALLNQYGHITPVSRQGSQIGINQQALAAALQQARTNQNAAEAAWLASLQKPAVTAAETKPAETVPGTPGGAEGPGGGESSGESGEGSGQGGESEGGDAGGEGGEGEGGDGYFKGGLIGSHISRSSNPLNKVPAASGNVATNAQDGVLANNPALAFALQKSMLAKNPSLQATSPTTPTAAALAAPATGFKQGGPIDAHMGLLAGGYVPQNTGKPHAVDDIKANVSNGEFVTRAPSVAAIGANNLAGLNKMNSASPRNQTIVRDALHAALNRARLANQ